MEQEKLNQLLQKYLAGQCTPEETQEVQRWYASVGEQSEDLPVTSREKKYLEHSLWQRIQVRLSKAGHELPVSLPRTGNQTKQRLLGTWMYAVAATFILLLVASILFLQNFSTEKNTTAGTAPLYEEYTNHSTLPEQLILSDGSAVQLQPQSKLQYPRTFGENSREVNLTGEAFFEVTRDENRPFQVHSGKLAVRVLGTSFNVRAYAEEDSVEVAVRTGRVSVHTLAESESGTNLPANPSTGAILLPDQKATLYLATKRLIKRTATYSKPVAERLAMRQIFSETPLPDVMRSLEEAYHVKIDFETPDLSNCTLTATLFDQPLEVKLEMICKSIGASFELNDRQVIIRGEGCR